MCRAVQLVALCMLCLLPPSVGAGQNALPSAAGDSLGLSGINREFEILPRGLLTNRSTLGELANALPALELQVLGVFAAGFGLRNRADGIDADFGFDWNAGDIADREVTAQATISELQSRWKGSSREHFRTIGTRFLSARRQSPVMPMCLVPLGVGPEADRAGRYAVAWLADGWVSVLRVLATQELGVDTFHVYFQALRLYPDITPYFTPSSSETSCLSRATELVSRQ